MSVKADSLWPPDLAATPGELPPLTILKQQAGLLGEMTKNLIEGEVETSQPVPPLSRILGNATLVLTEGDVVTRAEEHQQLLRHTFFLVAPALNFYRHLLLEVEHPATRLYPAVIKVVRLDNDSNRTVERYDAINSEHFKDILKMIFDHIETKRIIGILLAQSLGQQQQL
jgi:hypothetical protein